MYFIGILLTLHILYNFIVVFVATKTIQVLLDSYKTALHFYFVVTEPRCTSLVSYVSFI